jgi:hypothetical protein
VGRLSGIETVLLELDGTLYMGSQVVPGAPGGGAVAARPGADGVEPDAVVDSVADLPGLLHGGAHPSGKA